MQAFTDQALYRYLKELEVINKHALDRAYEQSLKKKTPLEDILLDKNLISDENLGKIISEVISVPFVRLSKVPIPRQVLRIIPEIVARKQRVICFKKDKTGIALAMTNPQNIEFAEFIERKSGDKVTKFFATQRDIDDALRLYSKELQSTFDELLKTQVDAYGHATQKDAPVAKIVDLLIEYAYHNKSSDIHIEPQEEQSLVRFRIDGVLHDVLRFPKNLHDQIVTRIKVLSKLRTDEHLSAQDGKLQVKLTEEDLDIRVSIVPIIDGEKVVMRLLSSKSRQFSLAELGMNKTDLARVKAGFSKPFGMVLSTGPTGSGKTTSIYAIVNVLNTRDKNIATIEDPVEYDIAGINQIQVNPKTNLTFADGLRAILRQDPDIIFVGEIRDKETAGIAVNSAMTGHLVLSTLHTNNAATSLPRLIDMGIEPFLVASTVNVLIGQRLVRKICEKCRFSIETKLEGDKWLLEGREDARLNILKTALTEKFGSGKKFRIYRGKGCPVCHTTGYSGRVGIFEVLTVTESIRNLITAKADADTILKKAREEGMTTMMDDGLEKIAGGITTLEEVLRATKE